MLECHDRRITHAMDFVLRDLSHRRTAEEVAYAAGLRPDYFSRRFRQITGRSFSEWNAVTRIAEAKRLLLTLDLSILSVALSVGYEDPTTFTRVFRRYERMCPRQFRRKLRRCAKPQQTSFADFESSNAETHR
jgi:two-component system, response regulator YesN